MECQVPIFSWIDQRSRSPYVKNFRKLLHIWRTCLLMGGGSSAGDSGADFRQTLTTVRATSPSTPETLGNWTDGRISCRHSTPASFLVIVTQPENWHSFYHPTEGRKLSWSRRLLHTDTVYMSGEFTHRTINRAWRRATMLTETNALLPSQTANLKKQKSNLQFDGNYVNYLIFIVTSLN